MFTGIIEEVGAVTQRAGSDLVIMAKHVLTDLHLGDSVAVEGACLTVTAIHDDRFVVQMSQETLQRTTLGQIKVGSAVNLERAMAVGGRFGGHFVLGHVDGVGRVVSIQPQGEFSLWRFQAPNDVVKYIVPKGSITVDGISLTVVEPSGDTFGVAIIPTTINTTTLKGKRPGDPVNLEADMIGKHLYHYINAAKQGNGVTLDFLSKHGFA